MTQPASVPFSGVAGRQRRHGGQPVPGHPICLERLKANLIATDAHPPGAPMSGLNEGWTFPLRRGGDTGRMPSAASPSPCFMIPRRSSARPLWPSPWRGPSAVSVSAAGCILAGLMKSYTGLILGFGILGGIGMGFGYAAATPAAVRWFGPHRSAACRRPGRGRLRRRGGRSTSSPLASISLPATVCPAGFIILGGFFAVVGRVAGLLLAWPPAGTSHRSCHPRHPARRR